MPKLTPAGPDDLAAALAFALKFEGRKRWHDADALMADIVAKRLVRHLERARYVVMERPPLGAHSAVARGFGQRLASAATIDTLGQQCARSRRKAMSGLIDKHGYDRVAERRNGSTMQGRRIKATVVLRQPDNEPGNRLTFRFVAFGSKGPYRGLKRFTHDRQGFRRKNCLFHVAPDRHLSSPVVLPS
jgi:hypothetical protein